MRDKKRDGNKAAIILGLVFIVICVFFMLIQFITDWMWFDEMGYVDVFLKKLMTQIEVGVPVFVIITLLVALYLNRLKKGYFKSIASSEVTDMKKLRKSTWLLSILGGALVSIFTVTELWFQILKFANASGFDIKDPLFNLDISFYIFKLEFLSRLNDIFIVVIIGFVVLTIIYYMMLMTVRTPDMFKEEEPEQPQYWQDENGTYHMYTQAEEDERYSGSSNPFEKAQEFAEGASSFFDKIGIHLDRSPKKPKPKKEFDNDNFHQLMRIASGKITLLGVIFFLMLGINFFLNQFDLLHAHSGAVYGAGFTDVNITLWMYRVLCGLSVVAAIAFIVCMHKKAYKKILTVPVIMIAVGLVGYGAGYLIQNFVVSPDEINKESKYLSYNIEYTQYAYDLEDVTVKSFAADNTLTGDDIINNTETIENIRINDFDPAEQFYNQTQSIRQYYTFNDVDNDRYNINGKYTQTFLTAREIDENKISDTWLNKHIKYTHGYGVALSRVDKVTTSGQPDVLIGNIPPVSEVEEIEITRPEIYFGELSNEYIVVGTDELEFDYPNGDSNSYTTYEGKAGIKMNLINRLMFSIREGSLKLLVSSNIDSNSKIIINRNIVQRVQTIMPYLSYEGDPYMVTVDGKLYWMMDAYTTSSYYPYSEPFTTDGTNYIRNSVKVVVDAYEGTVNFYIVDESDPIALTMQKIYPTLFKNFSDMPEGLQEHLRYPNTMFEIQANVYGRYHMEDVNVFYQNEDQWEIASEIYGMDKVTITPNYYIAKLPGESKAEFFNSVPFTPKSKQNMTALMIARNDGDNYGELVLYQFPKSRTIYGPEQIEAQIDQNTEISKEFSLWNSSGTTYRRGNLFVIPIETSVLYVEPVYLEAQNSSIPEVKRIIMVYKDEIAYGETMADCLTTLFGSKAAQAVTGQKGTDSAVTPAVSDETGETVTEDTGYTPIAGSETMTQEEIINAAQTSYENAVKAQESGDWAAYGKYLDELEKYLYQLQ